jgi:tRNA modification GTPase
MDMMLESILAVGARIARPGEFSQRAFLNGKMDLAQAEAVADLIDAGTRQAVLGASRSLQGAFSREVTNIGTALMQLRMRLEATIDFPDEDIDALGNALLEEKLQAVLAQLTQLQHQAQQGQLLKDGITIAIIGQPNAGKSSLLNCLTGNETAIVTPIAGTTRDIIKETIHIDGLPIHIVDTAGIRDNADLVEMEGIRRAKVQQGLADRILLVVDATATPRLSTIEQAILQEHAGKVTVVINKIDLTQDAPGGHDEGFYISAKNLTGLVPLRQHVKECAGFIGENAGLFIARRRHIFALQNTQAHCQNALAQLHEGGIDIVGEELRRAQVALGEIVGKVTADDLLGEIFSHFCIGK